MDDFDLGGDLDIDGLDTDMSVTDLLNVELVKTKEDGISIGLKKKIKSKSNTKTAKALWGQVDIAEDQILPSQYDHDVAADSLPDYANMQSKEGFIIKCCECSSTSTVPAASTIVVCVCCNQSLNILTRTQPPDKNIPFDTTVAECRPCPDTGREMQFSDWCDRLSRFYAKYDAQKVMGRQIGQILRSWGGREDELLTRMISRHGPEPSLDDGTSLLAAVLGGAKAPEDVGGDVPLSDIPPEPLSGKVIIEVPQRGTSIGCDVQKMKSANTQGLVIVSISSVGLAANSDLMSGHIIHKCNGKLTDSLQTLREAISESESDITFVVSIAANLVKCPSETCPSISGNATSKIEAISYCDCRCLLCDKTFMLSKEPLVSSNKCPTTSKAMTSEEWKTRFLDYITSYQLEKQVLSCDRKNSDQLHINLDELVRVWHGREAVFLEKLIRKYGPEKSTKSHVTLHDLIVTKSDITCFDTTECNVGLLLSISENDPHAINSSLVPGNVIHTVCGEPTNTVKQLTALLENINETDGFKITVSLCTDNLTCTSCGGQRVIPESSTTFLCPVCGIVMSAAKQPLTCSSCPVTGGEMTFQEWRVRLARFYAKYAPEKVPGRGLDQILRSWSGREADLLSRMIQRYGPEPDTESGDKLLQQVLSSAAPPPPEDEIEIDMKTEKSKNRTKSKSFFKTILDKTRERIPNQPKKKDNSGSSKTSKG